MSEPKQNISLNLRGNKDRIFETPGYPQPFEFNESVADVFDDMVQRSIPLYCEVTTTTVEWSTRLYQKGTVIYDLGCSTGTTIEAIAAKLSRQNLKARFIGVDNSAAMLERARKKLSDQAMKHEIDLSCEDIAKTHFQNASIVIANYTLQFIPVEQRLGLLKKIHDALVPGGMIFLSEKVKSPFQSIEDTITNIYQDFKKEKGYSKTEIARKKEALDQVLISLDWKDQMQLLVDAGFSKVDPVIKWNNFLSIVAIKD